MNDPLIIQRVNSLENNGEVTPNAVVDDARDVNSPLHSMFEWDDSVAGEKYRLGQARTLIRSVRIVITEEKHQIKSVAYVRNPDAEPHEQGYISTTTLKTNKEKATSALVQELNRAENALQRAYDVADSLGLSGEVDLLLARIRGIKNVA